MYYYRLRVEVDKKITGTKETTHLSPSKTLDNKIYLKSFIDKFGSQDYRDMSLDNFDFPIIYEKAVKLRKMDFYSVHLKLEKFNYVFSDRVKSVFEKFQDDIDFKEIKLIDSKGEIDDESYYVPIIDALSDNDIETQKSVWNDFLNDSNDEKLEINNLDDLVNRPSDHPVLKKLVIKDKLKRHFFTVKNDGFLYLSQELVEDLKRIKVTGVMNFYRKLLVMQ